MLTKAIIIAPLIAIFVGAIGVTMAQQQAHAITAGALAARQDWANGGTRDDSCNDHGYSSVLDPGFCLSFKFDYDAQWVILGLAQ